MDRRHSTYARRIVFRGAAKRFESAGWIAMFRVSLIPLVAAVLLGACTVHSEDSLQPGLAAIHKGRYAEAENVFATLLLKDPGNPYVLLNLGVAKARLGKTGEAAELYRKAVLTGGNAPVRSVLLHGTGQDVESTVAAIASQNLAKLGN